MNEVKSKSSPAKRGGWLRKLLLLAGLLLVLIVMTFFVVTSGAFVKGVILPKVGTAMNADLAVGEVQLSPFSQLVLRDLKLTPKGAEPLLMASLVRVRYSLFAILRGNIVVEEVTVESPTVTLVENADGTSNLDPLTKNQNQTPAQPAAKASGPPQLDIKSVALKNATIKRTKNLKGGGRESVELANVNLTLTNLKNGASGKLDLSASLALDNSAPTNAARLAGKLSAEFAFDLTPDLKPGRASGKAVFSIANAAGSFADFANLGVTLDCEATPTEVKQLALKFTQSGQALGEVRVSGPFDPAKTEGKLSVAVLSLDRRVLNLAGAASGIDFGTTVINSTNLIELAKGGASITASGQLDAAGVRITRQSQTTPTLDLRCVYDVTVDRTAQTALLKTLNLTGMQDSRLLLVGALSSPMTIAFGGASSAVGDAALNLNLTDLNLADWRAFAADLAPTGLANLKMKLLSQQGGKQLAFDLDGQLKGMGAKFGDQKISDADVKLLARGSGTDLKQFKLDEYRVELVQQGQSVLTLAGAGTFDSGTQDADMQIVLQATLARLLILFPQPDASLTGGTVELKGRVTNKQPNQTVVGQLTLANLSGRYGSFNFTDFGTAVDLDVAMKAKQLEIRKATGTLRSGANVGGSFEVTGKVDTARKAGQLALKLTDFNQNGLRPFLESALGDKKLVSISLNTTASASFEANGDGAVKADLQLANLVVNDPKGSLPSTPLEAKARLDAGVAKSVAQVRQCELTLTPTDRASNKLNLTGSVDYSKTNATTGSLKLAADQLDVTRYYELFAGGTNASAKPTAQSPAPADNKEPEAMKLPFNNFSLEASVGKFYLREVEATNVQFVVKLDGGRVLLKPAQFTLNGAPVNAMADVDLGVPGYKYDVSFGASPIPLEPLVNSFMPERKGQIHGVTLANAKFKGAGITGASLRKNLSGEFSFASTNLNLAISDLRTTVIKEIINVIVAIPELIRNPVATLGNFAARLTGGGTKGGFTDEIMSRPIDSVVARGRAVDGRITFEQAQVSSSVFLASAAGEITLADVLTNSAIHFPVHVSLSRPLAEKVGLAGNTPTNQALAALPDFLTMKGTVGKPEKSINALVLGATAAKAVGGVATQIGGAAGEKVGGVLNLLGGLVGGNPQPAAPAGANPPAANAPAASKSQPASAGTNTVKAVTNAPPSNTQPQQQINILDLFKKPKK